MTDPRPADPAAVSAWLARSDALLEHYVDATHHTYLELYLDRADARHALGEPPGAVLAELAAAARCYAAHAALLLSRLPAWRLRARRLDPLEVALVTGEPAALGAARDVVAVDPFALLARSELPAFTGDLDAALPAPGASLLDPPGRAAGERVGRLALLWWGGLSALVLGAVDGLAAVRARARADLAEAGPAADRDPGGLGRLAALHRGLDAAASGDPAALAAAAGRHAALAAAARAAADGSSPEGDAAPCRGALDRTTLALVAAALACGLDAASALRRPEAGPYGAALAAYADALAS